MYCSYIQVPTPICANQTCTKAIQDNTSDTGTEVLFTEHILEFEIRLFGAKSLSLTASLKREIFFRNGNPTLVMIKQCSFTKEICSTRRRHDGRAGV